MAGLALAVGCDSDPKPASTATLFNKEEVHSAIQELDSQIGALEEDADAFDSENWRDVVPRIKEGTESVRSALDNLKKARGYFVLESPVGAFAPRSGQLIPSQSLYELTDDQVGSDICAALMLDLRNRVHHGCMMHASEMVPDLRQGRVCLVLGQVHGNLSGHN
jgi:hypothetical protein